MKAVTFQGIHDVQCDSLPEPGLEQPNDVILSVHSAGVCGSDLHVYEGRETGLDRGTIMGHEVVGEVVVTGREVMNLQVGDQAVSPFTTNCGECYFCRIGLTARCETGQLFGWVEKGEGLHGCQAEYVRVPHADSTLVKIPEGLPQEQALFAGDVLATGLFGAESAGARPGASVAIVGCGPVGLMALLASIELGADRAFAIDRIPERLLLAERMGATPVAFDLESPTERIAEATHRQGVDAVVEAVGSPQALRLAIDLVRPGGTVASVGVHTEEHLAFSPLEAYDKNLTYKTGRCPARHYLQRALDLIGTGRWELEALISHRMPLEEGPLAYEIFAGRTSGCTKVLLQP